MGQRENINGTIFFRTRAFLCEIFPLLLILFALSPAQDSKVRFERDPKRGEQIAIGLTPRSILRDTMYSYYRWFNRGYSGYAPDTNLTARLKEALTGDVELLVFYGTWCSDTKRELPRLMRILDAAGFPESRLKMFGVNRAKQTGDDYAKDHDIKLVPTVIIYKEGKELGRIIEKPKLGLEPDMLEILKVKSEESK